MAQPRLKDSYDWVVMGDSPGALLAGCLAARRGLSVLIAGLGPSSEVRTSKNDIPLDPESNWILGLGRGERMNGLVYQCLSEIGLSPAEGEKIKQPRGSFTMATPRMRLTLMVEHEQFVRELKRELGEVTFSKLGFAEVLRASRDAIVESWFQLPARLSDQKPAQGEVRKRRPRVIPHDRVNRDLFRKLARNSKLTDRTQRSWATCGKQAWDSAPVQELAAALRTGAFGFSSPVNELPDLSLIKGLEGAALASTGARFEGGVSALRAFLLNVAQRAGAQVPNEAEVSQIFVEGGRFAGVQLSHKSKMIACSGGILGCALEHALKRVSTSGSSWLKRPVTPPIPTGWLFTISVVARAEALPEKVSDRLIWIEGGSPGVEIEISDCEDYDYAEAGSRLIFCRTLLPFTKDSLNPRNLRLVASRMFKKLSELFPFLEFYVNSIYPDFRSSVSLALDEISEAYPYHTPSDIPESLRSYAGTRGVRTSTGIDRLYVASGESFPEWGSLGSVVAGLESLAISAQRTPG